MRETDQSTVRLQCVGTGDAFGSGGRLHSCYHLACHGETLLVDCGCSSLIGLRRCGLDPAMLSAVVVSHLHGDHFGGIPFLLLDAKLVSRRTRPLRLIGPRGLRRQVEAAMNALYPGVLAAGFEFALEYGVLEPRQAHSCGVYTIEPWPVKHGSSPDVFGLRIDTGAKIVSYSGDTEWTDNLIPLARNADLLIAECCTYRTRLPAHLDYFTLREKRARLHCRRIALTHMGPEVLSRLSDIEFTTLDDGDIIEL